MDTVLAAQPVEPTPLRKTPLLLTCWWGMALLSLSCAAPAVLASSIGETFGIDRAKMGQFLGASFWGVTAGVLLTGPIADRIGFRLPLLVSALFQSAGCLLLAVARTPMAAGIASALIGAGTGLIDGLATPLVCSLYPQRRTTVANVLHAFFPLGLLSTTGVILLLMWAGLNWRWTFAVLATFPVPFAAAVLLLKFPNHSHEGATRLRTRTLLKRAGFLLLFGSMLFLGLGEMGPMQWLPQFIESTTSAGKFAGAAGMIAFSLTMLVGRFAAASVIRRLGGRRMFILDGVACSAALLLAAMAIGPIWTICWLSVLGFAVASFWPTLMGVAGDRFPAAGASMYSLLSAVGNIGGAIGPMTIGLIAQKQSLALAMAVMAVVPLMAMILATLRVRTDPA